MVLEILKLIINLSCLFLNIYDFMVDLSTKLGGVYSAEHGTGKRKRNDFKKCLTLK